MASASHRVARRCQFVALVAAAATALVACGESCVTFYPRSLRVSDLKPHSIGCPRPPYSPPDAPDFDGSWWQPASGTTVFDCQQGGTLQLLASGQMRYVDAATGLATLWSRVNGGIRVCG